MFSKQRSQGRVETLVLVAVVVQSTALYDAWAERCFVKNKWKQMDECKLLSLTRHGPINDVPIAILTTQIQ